MSYFLNIHIVSYIEGHIRCTRSTLFKFDIVDLQYRLRSSILYMIPGGENNIAYDIIYYLQFLTTFIPRLMTLLPRLPHVCAEESQQLLPWIPASALASSSWQLHPQQKTHPETSCHTSRSRCWLLPVPLSGLESAAVSRGILDLKLCGTVLRELPFK